MKLLFSANLAKMKQKMAPFGTFDMTYIKINDQHDYGALSTIKSDCDEGCHLFSNRFMHFMQLVSIGHVKFYIQKHSIWHQAIETNAVHQIVLIKKEIDKVTLFIFQSSRRDEVVRLMLHKEVVKRMALYIEENCPLVLNQTVLQTMPSLFGTLHDGLGYTLVNHQFALMQSILTMHLTQKEAHYVEAFWQHRSLSRITQSSGLSRSYINNILLSAAHKLGLGQVRDLLSLQGTSSILLKRGKQNEIRLD